MNPILARLSLEAWAMEPAALQDLFRTVEARSAAALARLPKVVVQEGQDPLAFFFDDDEEEPRRDMSVVDGVARIPIAGVLLKSVPRWVRAFGIDATGYDEIRANLAKARESKAVRAIVLDIESPGGQVAGVEAAAAAVREAAAAKPLSAEIGSLGASASYWLASQAPTISAMPNALVGSIGVLSVYVDSSAAAERLGYKVHVVASGPHKGTGTWGAPITEAQLAVLRENIDAIAANFVRAIAGGRRVGEEKAREWATGRLWEAGRARDLGVIDKVGSVSTAAPVVPGAAAHENKSSEEETMPHEDKKDSAAEVLAAERDRQKAIKGAFPKDPAFALEAIEKGLSVLEAKAAYADKLQAKVDEDAQKLAASEQARTQAEEKLVQAQKGPDAIPFRPTADAGQPQGEKDFMAAARAYREEGGKDEHGQYRRSMREAMSHVAYTQPKLHEAFIASQRERAEEVHKRKVKLCMISPVPAKK